MAPPIIELPSPNCDARPGGVDMLILHYTGMQTAQAAIDRLRDPVAQVSSHYVVDEDGTIYRLVPEAQRAFHAGISFWRGRTALNHVSIGIEIVNPGHEWGYRPFPEAQMRAVLKLSQDILARHPIPPAHVLGHSDVAPNRKQDPGEFFPWRFLAEQGVGLWPHGTPDLGTGGELTEAADLQPVRADLAAVGYELAPRGATDGALATILTAFQRHWRPETINGLADAGTVARLAAVVALLRPTP